MMSGSASRIVQPATGTAIAADVLARAGIAAGDLAALQALPVATLLDIQNRVLATDLGERNAPGGRTLGLVLDGISLPRHPLDAIAAGAGITIPMVLGYTRHEARMWYAAGIMGPADPARLARTIARFEPDNVAQIRADLARQHPGADPTRQEEAFLSDRIYQRPARRTAEAQRAAAGRAWLYEFAWQPRPPHDALGASHGFDEPFTFGLRAPGRVPLVAGDSTAAPLAARMEAALIAFCRSGDPGWQTEVETFG
jgi:para-nitrobenzyl esterase